MKTALSAQQIVYFRQHGHIRFEPSPLDFGTVDRVDGVERDLWRKSPGLKKLIDKTIAPLALELSGRGQLRLGCDQWVEGTLPGGRMQDGFCLQGIVVIAAISQGALDFYDPSSLVSLLVPPAYLVVYTTEKARYVQNAKDPHSLELRKMGYNYGDLLINEFHPLMFVH